MNLKTMLRRYEPSSGKIIPKEKSGLDYAIRAIINGFDIGQGKNLYVLCIDIYFRGEAVYTVYVMQDGEYITLDRRDGTWRKACLYNLINWVPECGGATIGHYSIGYIDEESKSIGNVYFNKASMDRRDTLSLVHEVQLKNLAVVQRNCENDSMVIKMIVDQCRKQPTDAEKKWADSHVMKDSRYAYARRNGRTVYGFCTNCGLTAEFDAPKDGRIAGKIGKCKCCKSKVTFKGGNFKGCIDENNFATFDVLNDGIVENLWYVQYKHRNGYMPIKVYECLNRQYISYNGSSVLYTRETGNVFERKIRADYKVAKPVNHYWGQTQMLAIGYRNICPIGLKTKFAGTPFEKCCLYNAAVKGKVTAEKWLFYFKAHPAFESAAKLGLITLCKEWEQFRKINSKSLKKALGLDSAELMILRKIDGGTNALSVLKLARDSGIRNIDAELLLKLEKINEYGNIDRRLLRVCNAVKKLERLCEFKAAYEKKKKNYFWCDYKDYICQCEKLGLDLKDNSVLFPKNLDERHEELSLIIAIQENKERDAEIGEIAKAKKELYRYESNDFIFRLAKSAVEIIQEGKALHHCVGGYVEKVAKGECVIVFCRNKTAPDKPLYTIEMRGDMGIQIRGLQNCDPDDDAAAAWKKYKNIVAKRFLKTEDKKTNKEKMKARAMV